LRRRAKDHPPAFSLMKWFGLVLALGLMVRARAILGYSRSGGWWVATVAGD